MAMRLFLVAAASSAAPFLVGGEAEVSIEDISLDDVCSPDDSSCTLSLRQLRGVPTSEGENAGVLDAAALEVTAPNDRPTPPAGVLDAAALEVTAPNDRPTPPAGVLDAAALEVTAPNDKPTPPAGVLDAAAASVEMSDDEVDALIAAEAAGGACVNQQGWDEDFANRAYRCAFKTLGNAWRAGRCMASWQHVSSECGTCMGELIHCGKKCIHECCYGRCNADAKCVECSQRNCAASFTACAGVPPPHA